MPSVEGPMRFLSAWLPFLLLEATVLFLSSRAGGSVQLPWGHVDKVLHFGEYAALALLLYRAMRMSGGGGRESIVGSWVLIAFLGWGDEAFQSHVPGRDSSVWDWVADVLGGGMGLALGSKLERVGRRWFLWGSGGVDPARRPRVQGGG